MEFLSKAYVLIPIINLLLAITVIFIERRNVVATWAWLMVLLLLPGIGFVIYLFLGQNLSKRKIYKRKQVQLQRMFSLVEEQERKLQQGALEFADPVTAEYQDLIALNLRNSYAYFSQDNLVDIYDNGNAKFSALFQSIEQAEQNIHLLYYRVRNDQLGRRLLDLLTRKAKQGVQVRLLYDSVGSLGLTKGSLAKLRAAGGQAVPFFPSLIPYINFRLNFRNHRKLVIIDGKWGYIGGFNIGNEYLGEDDQVGPWRDTHLRVTGSVVHQMQAQFILDWNLASSVKIRDMEIYFPPIHSGGSVGMQLISSGPNNDREQVKSAMIKMINSAQKTLYLQTPYFVPDESFLNALRLAVLSGVDVRIMLPKKPDHKIMEWAANSYLGELLQLGAKCYLYHKGFLHAKTIVVDGQVASVGTANIDIRSFKLNFEVNAILYGCSGACKLQQIFEADMQNCTELTLEQYQNRPLTSRIMESLTRLLSPIL